MNPLVFMPLAVLIIASALVVVLHPNPVRGACALVVTLFLLAVFFVGLDAHLVAVLQVIVYAGAIVVLFLFVIMLLNVQTEQRTMGPVPAAITAVLGSGALAGIVMAVLARRAPVPDATVDAGFGRTTAVAERLFTAYLLPFELTGLLLLVAILGAVVLAPRRS